MRKFTNLWSVLSIVLYSSIMLSSCTKDDIHIIDNEESTQKIILSGSINQNYQTRVNDDGFVNDDAVGIYITDYNGSTPGELLDGGNRADNVEHTFDEVAYKWTPSRDIYWKDDKTKVDIYGYYPYGDPTSISSYEFEVEKDQSKSAEYGNMGGYEASDFLWGKSENITPTDKVIKLSFKHKMASAKVTLAEGTGFDTGEWVAAEKAILVLNTKRSASIDLNTGVVTAVGDVPNTGTIPFKRSDDFRCIVVPQDVSTNTPLFSITVDGTPYIFRKNETFVYVPSKMHNFTITVNKKAASGGLEFVLTSESITVWENDDISHDATAREYIVVNVTENETLKEAIAAASKDFTKVKNLKITGVIDANDFYFMRDEMGLLQALNLQEVKIGAYIDQFGNIISKANEIPIEAMRDKSSLMRLVLPEQITRINDWAFGECLNIVGSLIIPEGVTYIGAGAFTGCKSMTGELSLPSTLEYIGGVYDYGSGAFRECGFTCKLILPENLEYLGAQVFYGCYGLYGELILPHKLEIIKKNTFTNCIGFTGSLIIPEGVKEIEEMAFAFDGVDGHYSGNFNGTLTLPKSLISIGKGAFMGAGFRGELDLPKELVIIPDNAFSGCDFTGELKIPSTVAVIGQNAFAYNWRLSGVLEIPKDVQSIGANAFESCRGIEGVIFTDGIETIARSAFNMCTGIGSIICKGVTPAYVLSGAFNGVPKDNFTLEVPESSISQYQTAVGWSDFKRISAYRNLVVRPNIANAINTTVVRELVLNADEEWIVESKPEWVTLDKSTGVGKTDIKLTFTEMANGSTNREGEVVFKLKTKDYRTRCKVNQYNYQYAEDQILTLQSSTKGSGVNLVFLGDGYNAKDISDGKYLQNINEAVKHFFDVEPYKSYKEYFNVYTGIALSPESGIGTINSIRYSRFGTTYKGGVGLGGVNDSDYSRIFEYACKAPTVNENNINKTLIVMVPNATEYAGICYMYNDGSAIAYCPMSDYGYPYDFRGVVQHEAGGHGFGKLADEYIYHNEFIDNCPCTCCPHDYEFRMAQSLGWYQNLSLTGKMNEVSWSHLIFHDKYSQIVDIYEGGFMHTRGVYRSEQNSCMNNMIPYFSAVSREDIVKRIKNIAGETYSFEDFVLKDVLTSSSVATRAVQDEYVSKRSMHQRAPIMKGERPKLNISNN